MPTKKSDTNGKSNGRKNPAIKNGQELRKPGRKKTPKKPIRKFGDGKSTGRPLSEKQKLWLHYYLNPGNNETFLNATASAKAAGYNCSSDDSFAQTGYQNVRKFQPEIKKWLDEEGLSETALKSLLIEGLRAEETRFFSFNGVVTETRTVIPWDIRRKYLELACKVQGMLAPTKIEASGPNGGPIQHSHALDDPATWKAILDALSGKTPDTELPNGRSIDAETDSGGGEK